MNPSKIKLLLFAFVCSVITSCSIEENGIYFNEINEVKEAYSIMELEKSEYTHFGISIEQNSEGRNYFTQIFIQQ